MDEAEFRNRFEPKKGLCADCKFLPKNGRKMRCEWCQLRKDGTDVEVASSHARRASEPVGQDAFRPKGFGRCWHCDSLVPQFYMDSGKRCRGCRLAAQRDATDLKKYGVGAGTRQQMYDRQDGRCFGCNRRQVFTGLAMHHNHQTGEPYFLACVRCNQGAGLFNDDPEAMIRFGQAMLNPPHRDLTVGYNQSETDDTDSP